LILGYARVSRYARFSVPELGYPIWAPSYRPFGATDIAPAAMARLSRIVVPDMPSFGKFGGKM
jgi:hypothetical protein